MFMKNTRLLLATCTVFTAGWLFSSTARSATYEFHSAGGILINNLAYTGPGNPYPSTITVANTGVVSAVRVKINGFTSNQPADADVFLVGPHGNVSVVFSDAGGEFLAEISNVNLVFDDTSEAVLPSGPRLVSGTYAPVNYPPVETAPPGSIGPIGENLSALAAEGANGVWSLFVTGDGGADNGSGGSIASWTLVVDSIGATLADASVSAITGSSALMSGQVTSDGGLPVLSRGMVWAPSEANPDPLVGGPDVLTLDAAGTTGGFTVTAEGLSPGTSYSFKAFAETSAGVSYSAVATFEMTAFPEIRNVAGEATPIPGAFLSGEVNPNGKLTTVHFEYGLDSGYGSSSAGIAIGSGTGFVATGTSIPAYTWSNSTPDAAWKALAMSADGSTLVGVVSAYPNLNRVWVSRDSGDSWSSINSNPVLNANDGWWSDAVSSGDGSTLVLANDGFNTGNYLYVSQDGGVTWQKRITDAPRRWTALASSRDGLKLAAVDRGLSGTAGGRIYLSTDRGVTWTPRGVDRLWVDVACSADGSKMVAITGTATGRVYTSNDSGLTWNEQPAAPAADWLAVTASADGSRLLAAVRNGPLYVSTDGGMSWLANDLVGQWAGVASSDDGLKLVAASKVPAGIYTSTDGGEVWLDEGQSYSWSSAALSSDGSSIAGAVLNGGIYVRDPLPVAAPLLWGATYHYRMVATSIAGVTYGDDQTLTTDLPDSFYQSIRQGAETVTAHFRRYSARGEHFRVLVQDDLGAFNSYAADDSRTYLGEVLGYPGAIACALVRSDGRIFSRVSFEDGVEWYSAGGEARVKGEPGGVIWPSITTPEGGAGSNIFAAEVGVDADSFYLAEFGGLDGSVEMIEYSVMAANMVYLRDVGIVHRLGRVILRGSSGMDPYNFDLDPERIFQDVFDEVGRQWDEVLPLDTQDMVMFVSPRGYGGWGTGGGVGSGAKTTNTPLEAFEEGDVSNIWRHEAGHNWGVSHFAGGIQTEDQIGTGPEWKTIMSGNQLSRFSVSEGAVIIASRDAVRDKLDDLGSFHLPLPPRAAMDRFAYVEGSNERIDVLRNDHDGNGDLLFLKGFQSVSDLGGTLLRSVGTGAGGRDQVFYQPPVGGLGGADDHFTYHLVDATGQEALGHVIIRDFSPTAVPGPANYTVTTLGDEVFITDVSGLADVLSLSMPEPGLMEVAAEGRAMTQDGVTFFDRAYVSLHGITGVTVDAGFGNDVITFEGNGGVVPSLTINGGGNDDAVNFLGDVYIADGGRLEVNLQDDAAEPGKDHVTIAEMARIHAFGQAGVVIKASGSIRTGSNSLIETDDGDILIEANQQSSPSSGNFAGVLLEGTIRVYGAGQVEIAGRGGDDPAGGQVGLEMGGRVHGGTTGLVSLTGVGGDSSGMLNAGVLFISKTAGVRTDGASVSVSGTGGSSGFYYGIGLRMPFGGEITAGGSGAVHLVGLGAGPDGTAGNRGIELGNNVNIGAANGNVTILGTGGPNSRGLEGNGSWYVGAGSQDGQVYIDAGSFQLRGGSLKGRVAFAPGSRLDFGLAGPDIDVGYNSLHVNGSVDLTGAELALSGNYPSSGTGTFILVDNDGTDPVAGTFNGLPEGSGVSLGGILRRLTYAGGDGNDVALTADPPLAALEIWRQNYFGSPANTGNGAPGADPDGDGWSNNSEFAFGTSPTVATPALTQTATVGGQFLISWLQRIDSPSAYTVQETADLATGPWVPSAALVQDGTGPVPPAGYEWKQISVVPAGKKFFRVTASL